MTEYTFTKTEKPAQVRETKPNPFAEAVKSLLTEDGKPSPDAALSFDVPEARIKTVQRQLRECGKPLNVTVRQRVDNSKRKDHKRVTFWTTERITHADAGKDE